MPEELAELDYRAEFSQEEFDRIAVGLVPEEMEDKWFIYLEGDTLHLHRSWTGHCIYRVEFERRGDAHAVRRAIVNRDPAEYQQTDAAYDAQLLDFLISNLLLGENLPFPLPAGLFKNAPPGLYQHIVSGSGYPEKRGDA